MILTLSNAKPITATVWDVQSSRAAGRTLKATVWLTDINGVTSVGWDTDQSGTITDALQFAASGVINIIPNGGTAIPAGTYTAAGYNVAITLRDNGCYWFIQGGVYTQYTLLWISTTGSAAGFPGIVGSAANFSVSKFIVLPKLLTIYPIASDTFTRSDGSLGATQTTGPESQTVESQDWQTGQNSTWTISSNMAINTPSAGSNAATDGGMETWSDANTLTNWTKAMGGTSTLNREAADLHGGTYAARMDIDSGNGGGALYQVMNWTIGDIIKAAYWSKSSVAGKTIAISNSAQTTIGPLRSLTTSYVQYTSVFRALNNSSGFKRVSGTSASLFWDDVTFSKLAISSCLTAIQASSLNCILEANFTIPVGAMAGLVFNLDTVQNNNSSPVVRELCNYRAVLLDTANIDVVELVNASSAGTADTRISQTAYTNVSAGRLQVVVDGTSVTVFYNGAKIGSANTMTVSLYTLCGLFVTEGVSVTNFRVYPLGTNGEYAPLGIY